MFASLGRTRRADLFVALALFVVGVLLRLPLAEFGETVDESLDPILAALFLRDDLKLVSPPFLHFGYGRTLSWVPLVLGAPEGLYEVALRRGLVQAMMAPVAFLAMRLFVTQLPGGGGGRTAVPALFALVLACNEDLLHTGISGHESYMAAEWVAFALLALAGRRSAPRVGALLLGGAVAMAVMNHPLAAPALVLLWVPSETRERRRVWAVALLFLLPQIVRVGSALLGGFSPDVAALPALGGEGRLHEMLAMFRPLKHVDVAVLVVGTPLACLVLWKTRFRRLAVLACVALALTPLIVLASGSQQGWYWRPLAPLGAVMGGLAVSAVLTGRRALVLCLAAGMTAISVGAVLRAGGAYGPFEDGLRNAGHVTRLGTYLHSHRSEGPWGVAALAIPSGEGRSQLLPLALDRRLSRTSEGLFSSGSERLTQPALLHLEVAPGEVPALRSRLAFEDAQVLASGRQYLILRMASGDAALSVAETLCAQARRPVEFDDTRRWLSHVGVSSSPWMRCGDNVLAEPGQ